MRSVALIFFVLALSLAACGRTEVRGSPGADAVAGTSRDAGACVLARPPPAGVERSPRGDGGLELLVLEGAPWLEVVDDATLARAASEDERLRRDGGGPKGFVPQWMWGVLVIFDDAGTAAFRTGDYHAWDCLNATWRAEPTTVGEVVVVHVAPIVRLDELAADYAQLPHVRLTEPEQPICEDCSCSDTCLDLGDGGEWTWLWFVENGQCRRDWYRARSEADGGLSPTERWSDGGQPEPWLDASPRCRAQLQP